MSELGELALPDAAASKPRSAFGSEAVRRGLSFLRANWRRQGSAPVYFTASSIAQSVAQMLAGFVIFRFVAVSDVGVWSSISLAQTYAFFLLAGVQNGLSRELPYYIGAEEPEMAERLAGTALFYTMGGAALVAAAGAVLCIYAIRMQADAKLVAAIATVTCLVIFKFYQNYLFLTYRSDNCFLILSKIQMLQAASSVFTLPLLLLHYNGMLVRLVVVGALAVFWMHRVRPMRVWPVWRTASFLILIRTGLPIFATDYVAACAATLDKVVLLKAGGVGQLGLYTMAVSVYAAFNVLPQSIAHYVYPRMSRHYGRSQDPRGLWRMAWKTALIVTGSMLPIAVAGSLALPFMVRIFFPKYIAGTTAAQIAMFTGVAYGATMGANALASLKAWSHLFSYQLSYSGLLAIGPLLGVRLFASPLRGVAYGMLAANVLGAVLSLTITFAATHRRRDDSTSVPVSYVPGA